MAFARGEVHGPWRSRSYGGRAPPGDFHVHAACIGVAGTARMLFWRPDPPCGLLGRTAPAPSGLASARVALHARTSRTLGHTYGSSKQRCVYGMHEREKKAG
jgi:hypothetical protein